MRREAESVTLDAARTLLADLEAARASEETLAQLRDLIDDLKAKDDER